MPKIMQLYRSKKISLLSGFLICILWLLIPFAHSFKLMAILSLIFGVCYGLFEVILNVQATSLEKKLNKPVLSSNQALIWDTLEKIGKNKNIKGFGKLFSNT